MGAIRCPGNIHSPFTTADSKSLKASSSPVCVCVCAFSGHLLPFPSTGTHRGGEPTSTEQLLLPAALPAVINLVESPETDASGPSQ